MHVVSRRIAGIVGYVVCVLVVMFTCWMTFREDYSQPVQMGAADQFKVRRPDPFFARMQWRRRNCRHAACIPR